MPTHVPVFIVTTWLLAMLPGAGQALMIRQSLQNGRRLTRATIAGNATGLLTWSTAAAAGLSAVLLANPHAYAVVRLLGGIVLLVLGITTLRGARRSTDAAPATSDPHGRGCWGAYSTGLATSLGNPKAGVFAVSVLPQFVTTRGPVLLSSIAMGVLWAAVNTCWYLLFTWAVSRGRDRISQPKVRRRLSMTTGVVLLVLGVAVAGGA
jgi:threonine/homoserine/homoserine lactone efflux protein